MNSHSVTQKLIVAAMACLLVVTGLQAGAQAHPTPASSAPDSPSGLVWQFQAVEAPKSFRAMQPRSLALDAAGRPSATWVVTTRC